MKKKLLLFMATLTIILCAVALVGCDFGVGEPPQLPNYNEDIQVVTPENITTEHFEVEQEKTYYTSPGFSLMVEVNGEFLEVDYFYLDGNKRVYDNLYFYEDDYFFIITSDYKDLYASLGDSADSEYAEEEKEQGEDIQINIKKAGKYKLIFDTDTLKFDLEYKEEIETPVYYTIKNCSIYTIATEWVEMSVNPSNPDEFVITDFTVEANKDMSFFNHLHTSNYKVTLDENCNGKYASARKTMVTAHIGGKYNIYINRKTYVVRMELLNPETASYSLVYYDGTNFNELQPYDASVPYVFRQRITVTTKNTTSVPSFHTSGYRTYSLFVVPSDLITKSTKYSYFKAIGVYELTINLKTFEISVELLPE